jgi:hypothetical protein
MLGKTLIVSSYVIITDNCPLAIKREGDDHVQIQCGNPPADGFEIVVQPGALRALVGLGTEMLQELDAGSPGTASAGTVER